MSDRFTAIVKIVQVKEHVSSSRDRGMPDAPVKQEVIDIEIRAKDLESMKSKLKAHIDLAEEL